jgi:predicted HAD superfamily Cof-like phosphohydrolase
MEQLDFIRERIERIEVCLDTNTTITQQILVQATKTNGRVNNLEGRVDTIIKVIWFTVGSLITFGGFYIQHWINKH